MEDTVDKLEAMFQKADSELNYLSRKLDFEFGKEGGGDGQTNPQQLLQQVSGVKKEFAVLVKEAQAIQQAQQDAMEFFRSQLTSACDMLQRLQQQTGTQDMEGDPPDLESLEKLLQMKLPKMFTAANPGETTAVGEVTQDSVQQGDAQLPSPTEKEETAVPLVPDVFQLSPSAARKDCDQCMELSKEDFESVSHFTRGRVKLTDVNHTYQRLWQHFREEGNSEALTSQDMYKMGLKVTGATGEAKLKVLRALKLITMSRTGAVTLVC